MNEKRLTFGEFVDEVRRNIKDYLPEKFADAEVHVDQFQKLNTAYLGMQVKREDQPERNVRTVSGAGPHYGSNADDDRAAGPDGS